MNSTNQFLGCLVILVMVLGVTYIISYFIAKTMVIKRKYIPKDIIIGEDSEEEISMICKIAQDAVKQIPEQNKAEKVIIETERTKVIADKIGSIQVKSKSHTVKDAILNITLDIFAILFVVGFLIIFSVFIFNLK